MAKNKKKKTHIVSAKGEFDATPEAAEKFLSGKEVLHEDELDRIAAKIGQQIHESLPANLQDDVHGETPIAMCAKEFLSNPARMQAMVEDAMDIAAEDLCNGGSVNVRFTKFKVRYMGTDKFHFGAYAVAEYAERLTAANPLEKGHPLTLSSAVAADIFAETVAFFREHHTEEDIVDGKGGFRLVEAEPAEAPNGEKVN